jgi:hypothetical protein
MSLNLEGNPPYAAKAGGLTLKAAFFDAAGLRHFPRSLKR